METDEILCIVFGVCVVLFFAITYPLGHRLQVRLLRKRYSAPFTPFIHGLIQRHDSEGLARALHVCIYKANSTKIKKTQEMDSAGQI